jgi:hypothetical protein
MRPTSCRIIGEVQAAGHTSLTAIAGQPPGRLSDIWVHFGDLPDEVREALWQRDESMEVLFGWIES